jgi:hypothetical protein
MPPAAAIETEQQVDGHAAVEIDGRLGAEDAVALPAPHRITSASRTGAFFAHLILLLLVNCG